MPESRKYTEAQKQSARKWDAANLDRISIAVPKGQKDVIKAHAEARGESVNAFVGGHRGNHAAGQRRSWGF